MTYLQTTRHANAAYRDDWVISRIKKYATTGSSSTALDVGAGLSPYRKTVEKLGLKYFSQDFDMYVPSTSQSPGLQNGEWNYPKHSFTCDVLDIPETSTYDFIICTEVFEHVPDPVALFKKLSALTHSGSHILITVPFISLMHQSPFWFSAGLSPFWFEYWAEKLSLNICELEVSGDYIDMMGQEVERLLAFRRPIRGLPRIAKLVPLFRGLLPTAVLQSGGFGTLCVLNKM